jgi:hypothetical protein
LRRAPCPQNDRSPHTPEPLYHKCAGSGIHPPLGSSNGSLSQKTTACARENCLLHEQVCTEGRVGSHTMACLMQSRAVALYSYASAGPVHASGSLICWRVSIGIGADPPSHDVHTLPGFLARTRVDISEIVVLLASPCASFLSDSTTCPQERATRLSIFTGPSGSASSHARARCLCRTPRRAYEHAQSPCISGRASSLQTRSG